MTAHVPLLLLILFLSGVWVHLFTDFFPAFGSVLGLTGVLAVVPALSGLMAENRRKLYAEALDRVLFQTPLSARLYVAILLLVMPIAYGGFTPVKISYDGAGPPLRLTVSVLAPDGAVDELSKVTLKSFESTRLPVLRRFQGGEQLRIVAAGLPRLQVPFETFDWPEISVPGDFWSTPLALLRPRIDSVSSLLARKPTLSITVTPPAAAGSTTPLDCNPIERYVGQPIWLGGGSGRIAVPEATLSLWLLEANLIAATARDATKSEAVGAILAAPESPCANQIATLSVGSTIAWQLRAAGSGQTKLGEGQAVVEAAARYPQDIALALEE